MSDPFQFGQFVTETTKEGQQTLVPGVAPILGPDSDDDLAHNDPCSFGPIVYTSKLA